MDIRGELGCRHCRCQNVNEGFGYAHVLELVSTASAATESGGLAASDNESGSGLYSLRVRIRAVNHPLIFGVNYVCPTLDPSPTTSPRGHKEGGSGDDDRVPQSSSPWYGVAGTLTKKNCSNFILFYYAIYII